MPCVFNRRNRRNVELAADQIDRKVLRVGLDQIDVEQNVVLHEPVVQRQAVDELYVAKTGLLHGATPSYASSLGKTPTSGGAPMAPAFHAGVSASSA